MIGEDIRSRAKHNLMKMLKAEEVLQIKANELDETKKEMNSLKTITLTLRQDYNAALMASEDYAARTLYQLESAERIKDANRNLVEEKRALEDEVER